MCLIPGQGTKIPHAFPRQKKEGIIIVPTLLECYKYHIIDRWLKFWLLHCFPSSSFSSVQFSCSVVSNSLQPFGLQPTRLSCPSPSSGDCSNLCPSSPVMTSNHLILCHPLLFLPSIFPSIRVFSNESGLRIGGQSIGASASASVLPMNVQD